jgi:hypothetical protein
MSTHRVSLDLSALVDPPATCPDCGGVLQGPSDRADAWCPGCRAAVRVAEGPGSDGETVPERGGSP